MVLYNTIKIDLYILFSLFLMKKMVKKTTSLKVDEELWKEVKIHCIKNNEDISDYIEHLIKNSIKKEVKKR